MGSLMEYDLFGIEVSSYQFADFDMPSDAQRIDKIKHLLSEGYEDKIVIAHDIHTHHRLVHIFLYLFNLCGGKEQNQLHIAKHKRTVICI